MKKYYDNNEIFITSILEEENEISIICNYYDVEKIVKEYIKQCVINNIDYSIMDFNYCNYELNYYDKEYIIGISKNNKLFINQLRNKNDDVLYTVTDIIYFYGNIDKKIYNKYLDLDIEILPSSTKIELIEISFDKRYCKTSFENNMCTQVWTDNDTYYSRTILSSNQEKLKEIGLEWKKFEEEFLNG